MAADFDFHQYFGKKKLKLLDNFESPYYCLNPTISEEMADSSYIYDKNNFIVKSQQDMMEYAARAVKACDAPIDLEKIIFVIHHSEFNPKHPNETLVFYEDGCVVRTAERTRDFMKRIFKRVGMSYPHMREMMKYTSNHSGQICPYVQGKVAFMPVNGPSKKDVSWISLSHLVDFREHPLDNGYTRLEFFNRNILDVQLTIKAFEKRIEPAVYMYAAQHRRLMETADQFDVELVRRDNRATKHILHKTMMAMPMIPTLDELALAEKMMMVTYSDWKKEYPVLRECPYVEDLDKLFLI